MKNRKWRFIPFAILVSFLAIILFIFVMSPRDWLEERARLTGRLWTSPTSGTMMLYYITEEERARNGFAQSSTSSRRYTVTKHYSKYVLHARNASTAEAVKSTVLDLRDDAPNGTGPVIMGVSTGTLWLWNEKLEMRDPLTLQSRFQEAGIKAANPQLAHVIPRDKSFLKLSEPHGTMLMKGTDARYYTIDSATAIIRPADEELLLAGGQGQPRDQAFQYIRPPGEAEFHTAMSSFLTTCFATSAGEWHGLLTDEEKSQLNKWSGRSRNPYGDVARQYYKCPFKMDDRNEPELRVGDLKQVGTERLLKSGFLIRKAGAVWDVPNPTSTLIICKEALGDDQPWVVVRLARDGSLVWALSTTLQEIDQVADAGDSVIFYGTRKEENSKQFQRPLDHIIWVNTTTGKVSDLYVADESSE